VPKFQTGIFDAIAHAATENNGNKALEPSRFGFQTKGLNISSREKTFYTSSNNLGACCRTLLLRDGKGIPRARTGRGHQATGSQFLYTRSYLSGNTFAQRDPLLTLDQTEGE